MRYIILIIFLAVTVHGQSTNQTAARPDFKPMFIDSPGAPSTPDGRWRINIGPAGQFIDLTYHELPKDGWSAAAWNIVSPDDWKAHPGWFVFMETESRVWAYAGDRLLVLVVEEPNKKATLNSHYPCAVPKEVFERLSAAAQKDVLKSK